MLNFLTNNKIHKILPLLVANKNILDTMPISYEKCQLNDHIQPDQYSDKFTVVVEGNIGCGKTSFLKYFSNNKDVQVLEEPVDKWTDLNGYNTLELMYSDPKRWSLAFQSYVQLTMLNNHIANHTRRVKMMERSLYSGRNCFVENLFKVGSMSIIEKEILNEWFIYLQDTTDIKVDLFVYLRTDPEVCLQRIKTRSRNEECGIPIEYLRNLHEFHEDWLINQKSFKRKGRLLILDANKDYKELVKDFKLHEDQLLNYHQFV